ETCNIIGDTDVYGFGIRLGFYFQYFAIMFAFWFDPETTRSARAALNVFTIAVFINEYRTSTIEGSLVMLEFFIVAMMTIFLTTATFPMDPLLRGRSRTSVCVMVILNVVYMLSSPWIAFKELGKGKKPGCEVKMMVFFAPVNVYSRGWEIAFKAVSAGAAVGAMFYLVLVVKYLKMESKITDSERVQLKSSSIIIVQVMVMVLSGGLGIGMLELTIIRNNIDLSAAPITSTGQLLPLLIGALSFGAVL
ncbi:hypothetical protein K440DRAFT_522773, partial [Wilcoxina mikolae CBS 423.85]